MFEVWIGWEGIEEPTHHEFDSEVERIAFCKGVKECSKYSGIGVLFYRTYDDAMQDVDQETFE